MRVLILAHDFPPLNSIGGRRPYSWYKHFPQWGIYPVVITKSWEETSGSTQEIAAQRGAGKIISEESPDRTLIRVPLRKTISEKLLARYGDSRFRLLRRMLTFLYQVLSQVSPLFDKNEILYTAAKKYLKTHRVDFIIATGEPFILFKHAHMLSRKFKIPWAADFRDGWYLNHITAQRTGLARTFIWQWEYYFEKKYISTCEFMISVDPILSAKLEALHYKKAYIIYNGFEELLPPDVPRNSSGPLVLCHGGTLYPGHQTEALLQAVAELDEARLIKPGDLRLLFLGVEFYPEQFDRLISYAASARKYLETSKRLPREQALQIIQSSDFLIVFTDRSTPVLPSKVYEYLASRRPAMVILNDHSMLSELVTRLRAGIVVESVEHLKHVLLEKIEAKKNNLLLFTGELNEEEALFYSRENQAHLLATILKKEFARWKQHH
ncbi:MAG: hypothetical protein ACHQD9_01050 [Chitinophagales bacterium]